MLGLFISAVEGAEATAIGLMCGGMFAAVVVTLFYWALILFSTVVAARVVEEGAELGETRRSFVRAVMLIAVGFVFLLSVLGLLGSLVGHNPNGLVVGVAFRLLGSVLYLALTAYAARASAKAYFESAYPADPEQPSRERRVRSYFEETPLPPSPLEPPEG
ncbi:MAG: hypothetical protein ACRC20_01375 [Segniliparus sp.]|uniref:hypothetical protein n=1 Tax=Segniliparus sp. TaxID=2804064 RepID=UPI003F41AF0B